MAETRPGGPTKSHQVRIREDIVEDLMRIAEDQTDEAARWKRPIHWQQVLRQAACEFIDRYNKEREVDNSNG